MSDRHKLSVGQLQLNDCKVLTL